MALQVATGTIAGTVTTEANRPLAGAIVSIETLGTRLVTDRDGRFASPVPAGRWKLTVESYGHHPTTLRVDVAEGRTLRLAVALAELAPPAAPPTLRVEVRNAEGVPLDLATVEVGELPRTAVGGAAVFRGLAPGNWPLLVRRLGFEPHDTTVTVGAVGITVAVVLRPKPIELEPIRVLVAGVSGSSPVTDDLIDFSTTPTTGVTKLTQSMLAGVPSVFEPDVLRSIQATSGVGAANDFNAHPAIRGGAPEHTRFTLDGIPILGPYHMFGIFGAFTPEAIEEAQVLRGGLPARIGGALGSAIALRSAVPDRFTIAGGVTGLTSRVAVGTRLGGVGSLMVAGRTTNWGFRQQCRLCGGVPYDFWDLQGHLTLSPGRQHRFELTTFGSDDRFIEDLGVVDVRSNLYSTSGNRAVGARWWWTPGSSWSLGVDLWRSRYRSALSSFPEVAQSEWAPTEGRLTLQGGSLSAVRTAPRWRLRVGIDGRMERSLLAGDSLALGYFQGSVDQRVTEVAGWVEWEGDVGALTLAPGLRGATRSAHLRGAIEPRLAARWRLSPSVTLSGAATATSQALHALRDDRAPVLGVPMFVLPTGQGTVSSATQFDVAVTATPSPGWRLEAAVFHRRLRDLPRWRPEGTRTLDQIVYERGTANGIELTAAKTSGPVAGWLKYTLAQTRLDPERGSYRPLWNRPHSIDGVAQLGLTRWLGLASRLSWNSGQPYWIAQGRFYGQEIDPTRPGLITTAYAFTVYSNQQAKLPSYARFDLLLKANVNLGRLAINPYGGLLNVGGRRNVLGYETDVGEGSLPVRRPIGQAPTFPVLGIDVRYRGGSR